MTLIYELLDKKEGVSFSPYVISALLFLKHKNIEFERTGLTFTELGPKIRELTNNEWSYVPTIKFDNGDIIYDSPKIAEYLDSKYPENPLFLTKNSAMDDFLKKFRPGVGYHAFKLVILDTFYACEGEDAEYMRKARESELKQTLEDFAANPTSNFKALIENLQPLVQILETSEFVEGDKPGYADYVVASHLQWIKVLNSKCHAKILDSLSPKTREWSDKIEGLFGGFLKNYKCNEPKNFTAEW
ncbi:hypothetical protein CONCODRAFT_79591 [Conidiobolus coronatus NRRL 28638]|uniref:GST N-terminal domain-containing protein n=1 Tax=Conidiobolus coronatus (strain ATCC 28846 / CBS 209.66 / NRRL 28638) TaxID=796925 RepID=A0A137P218_CONC2|nr:hypothetical protein CONCODRAFT_79591 [Conidiobolus coronatus NRRL 28638]|eukprot:KXN68931.1 hypothetical protein CONCODRAFT_79591 [Conidiobolus coronatus NRRL 28638]